MEREQNATIRRQMSLVERRTKQQVRDNDKTLSKIKQLANQGKHEEAKQLASELLKGREQVKTYESLGSSLR